MDFFYKTIETAQEYTRQAAATASTSAQELAQQVSSRTATLATQAGQASSAAAEQASERFKGLQLTEALQKQLDALHHNTQTRPGSAPSKEQLEAYGIRPDFQSFVRSLTYSTFRDFPQDPADTSSPSAEGPQDKETRYLTPWQEQHALLVVHEVKEINELRFVLCPKRMTDKQFWHTYFQLARKHLPAEAFDLDFQPRQLAAPSTSQPDFQARLQQISASAQHWGTSTAASVAALARQSARSDTKEPDHTYASPAEDQDHPANSLPAEAQLAADSDLDAYLQDAMGKDGEDAPGEYAGSTGSPDGDDDFDQYLRELNSGEDSGPVSDAQAVEKAKEEAEEEVVAGSDGISTPDTLDEYVKDLQ